MEKTELVLIDKATGLPVEDFYQLMLDSGIKNYGCDYEDMGVQSDGTLIVCDKCGHFGYLDMGKYELDISTKILT